MPAHQLTGRARCAVVIAASWLDFFFAADGSRDLDDSVFGRDEAWGADGSTDPISLSMM
jgi:hypothetical protein